MSTENIAEPVEELIAPINVKSPTQCAMERLEAEIDKKLAFLNWLRKNAARIDELGLEPSFACDKVDFDFLSHADVVRVMQAFPAGKWNKELAGASEGKIHYEAVYCGIPIRCYAGEPPPHCQVVDEEVIIPAQPERKEIRKKLVCKPETEEATA